MLVRSLVIVFKLIGNLLSTVCSALSLPVALFYSILIALFRALFFPPPNQLKMVGHHWFWQRCKSLSTTSVVARTCVKWNDHVATRPVAHKS